MLRRSCATANGSAAANPTGAIIDSQSVKTTEGGGPRGYDAAKKINGRKRHALVDMDGRGLVLELHPARYFAHNSHDVVLRWRSIARLGVSKSCAAVDHFNRDIVERGTYGTKCDKAVN